MPIIHKTEVLRSRATADITIPIVDIDEEFGEFCPAGAPGNRLRHIVAW